MCPPAALFVSYRLVVVSGFNEREKNAYCVFYNVCFCPFARPVFRVVH